MWDWKDVVFFKGKIATPCLLHSIDDQILLSIKIYIYKENDGYVGNIDNWK